MAGLRNRHALALCLRLAALVCLFSLAACSSGGKQPNEAEKEDLATFRLSRVTAKAATQPTTADTNKSLVTVTFTTKIASAATGTLEPAGMKFDVYEGAQHLGMRTLEWDGEIQWQKTFEIEQGVVYPYQMLRFQIVGQSPHRGTRSVCLEVNPTAQGESVAFDCTNGATRAPIASENAQPRPGADGKVLPESIPDIYVRELKMTSAAPDRSTVSPVTQQVRRHVYGLKACLNFLRQDRAEVPPRLDFTVEGFGTLNADEFAEGRAQEIGPGRFAQKVKTDKDGCFDFISSFDDFQFVTAQRSFRRTVKICSENNVVRKLPCKTHVIYVDPWEANDKAYSNAIFEDGRELELVGRRPKLDAISIDVCNGDVRCEAERASLPPAKSGLQPPLIQLNGYVTNFMGRKFAIDENLNIGSQRTYEFAFKPSLVRWTEKGYKSVDLNGGRFRVKLLVLKTHGESPDQFPQNEDGIKARKEEEICFNKDDPFDLVADKEQRARCYALSYIDYRELSVEAKGGEFQFPVTLNFNDIRYLYSKNLLLVEISPENDPATGIHPTAFAGIFIPLEDNSRRLRDAQNRGFDFATTDDARDQIRVDFDSLFERWEKDEFLPGVEQTLRTLAAGLQGREGTLLNDELDLRRNIEAKADGYFFTPDSRQKRQIVLRTLKDKFRPEPISEIMEQVRRERGNVVSLDDLRLGKGGRKGMEKVELYRRMNRLEAVSNAHAAADRETILKSIRPRFDAIGQASELEALLAETPEAHAALGRACEAIYPMRDRDEAEKEAGKFAATERAAATAAYSKQREILCKIQDVIAAKVYDNVDLDISKMKGGCEDTRVLCTRPIVAAKDSPEMSAFAKGLRWLIPSTGDGSPGRVCGKKLPERENALLRAIQTNDTNLLQSVLGAKGAAENWAVEGLARQYLTQMPFSLVRAEVVKRLDDASAAPQFKLGEILVDPRSLDERSPAHRKLLERFRPRLIQDRCKAAPLEYLSLDVSEHVLRVLGRPATVRAGSTNISVFANLTHGEHKNDSSYTGVSRQNVVQSSAKASLGTGANVQAGFSINGGVASASATVSERTDLGSEKSISASQTWYISETRSDVKNRGASAGEAASRTLNAEEVSFEFKAETITCLSIQGLDRATLTPLRGGLLSCREQPEIQEKIFETWYYIYLFFRSSNTAWQDGTESLVMRPWTLLIRGADQFEWFKNMLQNSALTVKLSPDRVPSPDQAMTEAFDGFASYRKRRDLPGLLKLKHLVPAPLAPAAGK